MSPQLDPRVAGRAGYERKGRERGNRQASEGPSSADLTPLRLADLPDHYVSIDPGGVHCGVAHWEHEVIESHTVTLVECYERSPDALYIELRDMKADGVGLVLCEDFTVQKNRIRQGARLPTVKVIGVIEYLCRQAGLECRLQSASIKTSIDPWLRVKTGINIDGEGSNGSGNYQSPLASNSHKRDAIRHGLYPALRDKRDRQSVRLVLTDHAVARGRPRPPGSAG